MPNKKKIVPGSLRPRSYPRKYLVIDDLAVELHERPIYVPIPEDILKQEDIGALKRFTRSVLKKLMKLDFYTWYHSIGDVVVESFFVRNNNMYPVIST
jgi:hypothetical protein